MPRTIESRIRSYQTRWSMVRDRARRFLRGWRRPKWKDAFSTAAEVEAGITYYYLHPRPDVVVHFFDFIDTGDHLAKALGTTGFLTEFLATNPDWQKEISALSKSGSSLLKGVFETAVSLVPMVGERALKLDEHSLIANDFYWSAFFASGKLDYVDHVIEESMLVGSPDVNRFEVGATAQWSLSANIRQHEMVEQHVRRRRDESAGGKSQLLSEALESDPSELLARHAKDFESLRRGWLPR